MLATTLATTSSKTSLADSSGRVKRYERGERAHARTTRSECQFDHSFRQCRPTNQSIPERCFYAFDGGEGGGEAMRGVVVVVRGRFVFDLPPRGSRGAHSVSQPPRRPGLLGGGVKARGRLPVKNCSQLAFMNVLSSLFFLVCASLKTCLEGPSMLLYSLES